MARYEHLPVFQNVYDLNLYFFKLTRGFPKDFKYGLAQEIKSLLTELLDQIIIANNSRKKSEELQKAIITIERIKIKVRLLHDLKIINLKSYKYFFKRLVEVTRQIERWLAWSKKGEARTECFVNN